MIGAHIEMANQAAAFFFVVSGNVVMLHPVFEGPPQNGDKLWLEQGSSVYFFYGTDSVALARKARTKAVERIQGDDR